MHSGVCFSSSSPALPAEFAEQRFRQCFPAEQPVGEHIVQEYNEKGPRSTFVFWTLLICFFRSRFFWVRASTSNFAWVYVFDKTSGSQTLICRSSSATSRLRLLSDNSLIFCCFLLQHSSRDLCSLSFFLARSKYFSNVLLSVVAFFSLS